MKPLNSLIIEGTFHELLIYHKKDGYVKFILNHRIESGMGVTFGVEIHRFIVEVRGKLSEKIMGYTSAVSKGF